MKYKQKTLWGIWLVWLGLWSENILACTVCFGDSDHPMVRGLEMSVLFMVVVTYLLLGGGVVAFLWLRRRARRLQEQATET